MESIQTKLVSIVSQIKSQNKIESKCICQEILTLVDEGYFMLETSLKLNLFRFIERYCRNHVVTKVMESDYFVPLDKNKIVKNIIWFLCFNSVRNAATAEAIVLSDGQNGIILEDVYKHSIFAAKRCREFVIFIFDQLYNCSTQFPLELFMDPGLNAKDLLCYITSYYPELNLKPDNRMLPIYQLFYFVNRDSEYWGSLVWAFLHLVAESIAMKPKNYNYFKDFLSSGLSTFLPCTYCSEHWDQLTKKFTTPNELPRLMYELHNKVSEMVNKKVLDWDEYRTIHQPKYRLMLNKVE